MAQAHAKPQHDYHLVNPSPWPIIGSVGGLTLAIGVLMYLMSKKAGDPQLWYILPGLILVIITMFGWWRDVIKEAHGDDQTPVVQLHLRYGMILFIASEVMFFVGWFWSFFDFALFPAPLEVAAAGTADQETTNLFLSEGVTALGTLVPDGMEVLDPFSLPLLNTLILLCSGTTVTWAHHALIHGDREGLKQGLWATVALGVLFSFIQAYEYSVAPFVFGQNTYSSAFYMATGFHGFHVLIGTIFLAVCLYRAYIGHFTSRQHFGFEAAAWYWHFVDVVWLFLFIAVYIWGGAGAEVH